MNELVPMRSTGADVEAYRASTEAATLCKEIVLATSSEIQKRKYVSVEGWQAIAVAHGCAAGARDVERVDGGVRAIGEVRRMSDGQLIAVAEGFVGEDEPTWYGGTMKRWKWGQQRGEKIWYDEDMPKRADYAIRAMAQTRAISRACRSAFAHVVVMMNAGLATTPAEEIPLEGFDRDTGEIIEAIPTNEPAAREKLDGPHTSKTALKAAVAKIVRAIEACGSVEAIDVVKEDCKRTINQARRDWPELIDGNPNCPEDIGLKGTIAKRREELTPAEDSETFKQLVATLEQVESLQGLSGWMVQHGDAVGSLDGEESRRFETIYDAKAAALKLVAQVSV